MSESLPTTDDLVQRAIERLDARRWDLKCGGCGHEAEVPQDPLRVNDYRCDQCGTVTSYGVAMPAIRINPHADRRFVVSTIQNAGQKATTDLVLERAYAARYAVELLSVCDPELYAILGKVVGLIDKAKDKALRLAKGEEVTPPAGQPLDAPMTP
jgi:hypothetical protein